MSNFWNSRVRALTPYVPGEQPRDTHLIKLNTNENPYPPSPLVIEAIQNAAGDTLRLYPDPQCTELRQAIADRYGVQIDNVFAGNGSDEVLAGVFAGFFEGGDVLFPDITYSFYPVYARLWNIPFRTVPVAEDFSLVTADYRQPCAGVIFPNPNAPTGRACSISDIRKVLEYHRNRVVVIDEAYCAFGAESAVPLVPQYPNLLTVHTLSKSASLAGLRAGFAIGNEDLIEGLCRIRDSFNSYTLDRLALAGAAAAIRDVAYYDAINARVISTRERVSEVLISRGWTVIPSKANFLFIRHPHRTGMEWYRFLREHGVLVRHFDKPRITDFLRVSIGTDKDMDAFLELTGNED